MLAWISRRWYSKTFCKGRELADGVWFLHFGILRLTEVSGDRNGIRRVVVPMRSGRSDILEPQTE